MISFVLLVLAQLLGATARLFTVVNTCPFTIWPAIYTDLSVAQNVPAFPTGWESPPATSVQFGVPDNWKAGRIWGRRDCNFSSTIIGPSACLDGGCNGGLECDTTSGTGVPPATVAEWTLQGSGNLDYYDVSLVDGYNLPMAIIPSANCSVATCPVDLGPACPAPLVGPLDSTGFPVGCKSACVANLDGNPSNSSNCCSGTFDTAATCPTSGVAFYSYFKGNCPDSYAYAFDESSGTALWTCSSSLNSDYTLTFCPPAPGSPAPAPISAVPSSLIPTGTPTPTVLAASGTTSTGAGSASTPSNASGNDNPDATTVSGARRVYVVGTSWAFLFVSCAMAGWVLGY